MNVKAKRKRVPNWPPGTVQEAAFRLGISESSLRNWRRLGPVPMTRTGRRVLEMLQKGGRR